MMDQTTALTATELRMVGADPFTYAELCTIAAGHGSHEGSSRLCDKTLQRWRRKGWIWNWRDGKSTLWALTDAGRAEKGVTP